MNGAKTVLFMTGLIVLFVVIGSLVGGRSGMWIAFALATVLNFGSYWFSDKIVLRMYGATPVTEREAPELLGIVRRLTQRAGLPMPAVYILPEQQPNAFATGRNPEHAAVAFSEGILRTLTLDELAGVAGHELAHIKNRDILISTLAATFAGAIGMLANMAQWALMFGFGRSDDDEGPNPLAMLPLIIIAPIAAIIIQMAVSRSREYIADEDGARIAGSPRGLANALRKLHYSAAQIPGPTNPGTAHLFIVNPLSGNSIMNWFSTHPPMEERINRLQALRV